MSWDSYITNLQANANVDQAAICGHDGSTWATSSGLTVAPAEAKAIVTALKGSAASLAATGIKVGGTKYMFLRGEDGKMALGKSGKVGVACYLTTQALVIGTHNDSQQAGSLNVAVGGIADYLIDSGY